MNDPGAMKAAPGVLETTARGLTAQLDLRKEGLMPKRTRSNDGSDRKHDCCCDMNPQRDAT